MRALDDFVVVDAGRKIGRIYRSPADDWFGGAKLDVIGELMHGCQRLANGESHSSLAQAHVVDPAASLQQRGLSQQENGSAKGNRRQ
jgi:hypothetical protein